MFEKKKQANNQLCVKFFTFSCSIGTNRGTLVLGYDNCVVIHAAESIILMNIYRFCDKICLLGVKAVCRPVYKWLSGPIKSTFLLPEHVKVFTFGLES